MTHFYLILILLMSTFSLMANDELEFYQLLKTYNELENLVILDKDKSILDKEENLFPGDLKSVSNHLKSVSNHCYRHDDNCLIGDDIEIEPYCDLSKYNINYESGKFEELASSGKPEPLAKTYQEFESEENFEISDIKKYLDKRLSGSFSTGVIYSDHYDQSILLNSLSLAFEVNPHFFIYLRITDYEGL